MFMLMVKSKDREDRQARKIMKEKRSKKRKPRFTDKQKRFVAEYLKDCNALQAAIRAGYDPQSSTTNTPRLIRIPHVAKAIEQGLMLQQQRTGIVADEILERINKQAIAAEADGDRPNALKALELLGKHLRLFPNSMEHSLQGDLNVSIKITDNFEAKDGSNNSKAKH